MATSTRQRASVAPIFRKQAAVRAQKENDDLVLLRDAYNKAGIATFVSTSMTVVNRGESYGGREIVYDNGIAHYRLTPLFWSYLRHAFNNATRACEVGKLDASTYSELLNRISRIYNMTLAQFGEDAVKSAEQTFTPTKWKRHCEGLAKPQELAIAENTHCAMPMPSSAYRYPENATGAYHPVSKTAIALVDAIREKALALGWTMNQLYRNTGMAHRDWGLVCYLGPDDKIGKIDRQSIEIVHPRASQSLRFYNHEVEQPWMKTGTPEVTA
jgi:hypothetical protein